jgi:hypothetical protein
MNAVRESFARYAAAVKLFKRLRPITPQTTDRIRIGNARSVTVQAAPGKPPVRLAH